MRYPFVPFPARGPLLWPKGKRLALVITINLEYWDLLKESAAPYYAGGPAILPDMLPGNIPDFPNFSWRETANAWACGAFSMLSSKLACVRAAR